MSSVPDPVFRAWRPRDFLVRVLALAALDVALSLGLVSLAVEPALNAGAPALLALLATLVALTAVPTVLGIATATAFVRVDVHREAVVLTHVGRSSLRPNLEGRLALRGLEAEWHRDDATTNLVLRPAVGPTIEVTSESPKALDRLANALRSRGVRLA